MTLLEAGRPGAITNSRVTILEFRLDRAFYQPGQPVSLLLRLQAAQPGELELEIKVSFLDEFIDTLSEKVTLIDNGQLFETEFNLTLPQETPRGYGFDLAVKSGETVLAAASTACDVLDGWPQMPRYGFFANFKAEETEAESNTRAWALSAYHVNVVQFYDWMYRHEDFIPPADDFIDPMGRAVSYATVRHKIAAIRKLNMSALAYGAVYGATPAFWEANPHWGIYQADGQPYSLEKLFYLMDISLGSPWAENILSQYEKAVTVAGFDGIHVDQYGYPKIAYTHGDSPQTLELAQLFPPIINAAARRVEAAKPGAGVIFNAVNNWPVETVAATEQKAVYIEVWPPYVEYKDLHDLIVRAQELAGSSENKKQVILAAYLSPFLPEGARPADNDTTAEAPHSVKGIIPTNPVERVAGAQHAALLATAAIYASGGFHLLLGENNGVLADPYYPHYGHFKPNFVVKMRQYYDFLVRYENILSNPAAQPIEPMLEIRQGDAAVEVSRDAKAGTVWTIGRQGATFTSLNLVNLAGLSNSLWNAYKEAPTELPGLELALTLPGNAAIKKIWLASPDDNGAAQEIVFRREELPGQLQRLTFELPRLAYWSLLVFENEASL